MLVPVIVIIGMSDGGSHWVDELLIEVELGNGTERHSDAVCRSLGMYSRHRQLAQFRDAVRARAHILAPSINSAQTQPPYPLPQVLWRSTRLLVPQPVAQRFLKFFFSLWLYSVHALRLWAPPRQVRALQA